MSEGLVEQDDVKIEKVRSMLDEETLRVLDAKFITQGFGAQEQLKHLKRAARNTVRANVFFDFEASPFDRHEAYCGRYSEFDMNLTSRSYMKYAQDLHYYRSCVLNTVKLMTATRSSCRQQLSFSLTT